MDVLVPVKCLENSGEVEGIKLCGGVIKKQNKTKPSPKCLAQGGLSIEGLFSLHCGILSRSN